MNYSLAFSIPELREMFKGEVIAPDDAGYDKARTLMMGGIDKRPSVIVRPTNAAEVAQIVRLARDSGLELAVRSGGHSGAGHSTTDGGIMLDLKLMKGLQIDAENRTVWAETGLTAGEVTNALAEHGLAVGFGDTGSVGIGGLTLGGGVGYLCRKYGLTIDSLLAAEVVTADGELVSTDAETHPDLFWAIRGGGGNFGVVTRLKFRLAELTQFTGGMLILPATADTIAGFVAAAAAAPEELSTIGNVMPAPPMPFLPAELHGQLVILAMLAFAGEDKAAEAAIAPFRALAKPLADMVKPMPYPQMYPPEDPDYHPTAVARTMFIENVDQETGETILGFLSESDASVRVAQLRVLGGAVARVPSEATAYAHRSGSIMVNVAAFYDGPADRLVREAWVKEFVSALDQGDATAYVNFLQDEGPERVRAAYPATTWERLARIKARYDPGNLFRLNQNIPPAAA
jgi:FAD/FMN-containing dehydrogenase